VPASVAETKVIDAAADKGYAAVREAGKGIEVEGKALYNKIKGPLKEEAPGEAVAGSVFDKLKLLKKADSFKDVVEVRQAVGEIARTGKGSERETARVAKQMLTKELDDLVPGTAENLATADKNKAISITVRKIEKKAARGNLTEKTFNKEAERAAEKPYTSEAEKMAYENYAKPGAGSGLLKAASYFDPTKHPMFSGAIGAPLAFMSSGASLPLHAGGYAARRMYDKGMRNRANDISMAIRSQAPAGFIPGSPEATIARVRESLLPPASYYPLMLAPPGPRER